jgi:hypothetical protein
VTAPASAKVAGMITSDQLTSVLSDILDDEEQVEGPTGWPWAAEPFPCSPVYFSRDDSTAFVYGTQGNSLSETTILQGLPAKRSQTCLLYRRPQ